MRKAPLPHSIDALLMGLHGNRNVTVKNVASGLKACFSCQPVLCVSDQVNTWRIPVRLQARELLLPSEGAVDGNILRMGDDDEDMFIAGGIISTQMPPRLVLYPSMSSLVMFLCLSIPYLFMALSSGMAHSVLKCNKNNYACLFLVCSIARRPGFH